MPQQSALKPEPLYDRFGRCVSCRLKDYHGEGCTIYNPVTEEPIMTKPIKDNPRVGGSKASQVFGTQEAAEQKKLTHFDVVVDRQVLHYFWREVECTIRVLEGRLRNSDDDAEFRTVLRTRIAQLEPVRDELYKLAVSASAAGK
jgi:hypothetical protein